jgi:hypothetical protein
MGRHTRLIKIFRFITNTLREAPCVGQRANRPISRDHIEAREFLSNLVLEGFGHAGAGLGFQFHLEMRCL